ncbi:LPS O-antigen length regulator Wzz(fepE) [Yersinia pekkanenii]|uniref:LPS O-antigen length regulator n=1 Tax=Yersinia pekkanenii TaxID=1288385 RepID=A0A0T9NIN7_9GAMM|nr:LPS O-antigen length regulator Wzz(fepE) [Yersinia pekkanenii]CNH12934.1 LPS O-antigen length regulator [Yersinia pekkanenii]CRY65419.1 LPS O-antigen length regulator [Yersinia pekkanenii]
MNDRTPKNDDVQVKNKNHDFSTLSVEKNEIDLFKLILIILKSKFKILFATFLFIVAGLFFAYNLPQQWTSTAIIVKPGDELSHVLDKITTDFSALNIDIGIDSDYFLSTFKQNFDSQDLRVKYLVNTNYFKKLMENHIDDEAYKNALIDNIVNNNISSQTNKDGSGSEYRYYILSHSAATATDARELLQGYINYVNKVVDADVDLKIKRALEQAKNISTKGYNIDLLRANNMQAAKIERLKHSISMADAAGIKKPIYGNASIIIDDPDFPITLGSDALKQKLKIEESLTDLTLIDPDFLNRKLYIDKLNELKVPDIEVTPFKYLQQPTEPTKTDPSKRRLVLVLFTLIGFIGSVSFVLATHFLRESKQNEEND